MAHCQVALKIVRVNRHGGKPALSSRNTPFPPLAVLLIFLTSFLNSPVTIQSDLVAQGRDTLEDAARLSAQVLELYRSGKTDEAIHMQRKVVAIRERLAPDDPATAYALIDLGDLYLELRKDNDATEVFQRALKIGESKATTNQMAISHIYERLGKIAFLKSADEEAEVLIKRSLEIRRKALGENTVALADSLMDLARLYYDVRRFTKGEGIYVEGLSILETNLGKTSAKAIQAMKGYGCTLLRAGEATRPQSPAEPDEVTKAFRKRAQCWLYGFDDNCADQPGEYASVVNGKATKLSIPSFPRGLARMLGGTIFIAVRIDENGKVVRAQPVCGTFLSELIEPSLNAAKESRFTPTLLNGKPIQVSGAITYHFVPSMGRP